jgi:hypothetical protein
MEIWLDKSHSLTEPKWARGDLRSNIDPSSKFQNLIHIVGVETAQPQPVSLWITKLMKFSTFEAFLENWRDRSVIGSIEARSGLISDLSHSERLVDLIERSVGFICHPLLGTVERLVNIIKDKENFPVEFKQIILGMPWPYPQRALDSMYFECLSD